jgi:hypothetical protein
MEVSLDLPRERMKIGLLPERRQFTFVALSHSEPEEDWLSVALPKVHRSGSWMQMDHNFL